MNEHLTIAFMTNRMDSKMDWFFDSLQKQMGDEAVKFIAISYFDNEGIRLSHGKPIHIHKPKPNVWNGEYRLTKAPWFAAASARNTALCLAEDGWILYVDDLSVCAPGFWHAVKDAMHRPNRITCGAYRKVKNLVVENGEIKSYDEFPAGWDTRWHQVGEDVTPCRGEWLYGCSLVAPVEALLTVGGWPEICDGLGSEDYVMGMAMQNAGFHLTYDRRSMTFESEELHHIEPAFKRSDYGVSPNDKSHAVLNMVKSGTRYFDNFYEGGIRKMRDEVLAGKPFPVVLCPEHEWFSGVALKDL